MTVTVFLARHASHAELGHVLSGRSDIALDSAGVAQAGRLADRLAAVQPVAIHSSPCRRARETAAIVAERHGVPVMVADALDEVDFGEWRGAHFGDLAHDPAWHEWNRARGTAPTPGGETMVQATARAVVHLAALNAGPVLCVSHCDIIRGVVAHHLGLDLDRLLAFDVDPASLTTLALDRGGARLVALNERTV